LGYSDPNTIGVIAEGAGGFTEIMTHLDDKNPEPRYCLLRKDHKVELAKTVKFVFISYDPEGLPVRRRTSVQANRKVVHDHCKPYHVMIQATTRADIQETDIMQRLGMAAGTANAVRDGATVPSPVAASPTADAPKKDEPKARPAPTPSGSFHGSGSGARSAVTTSRPSATPLSGKTTGSGAVAFVDDTPFKAAMAKLRDDKSDTNWLLAKWEEKDKLVFVNSGTGGVAELLNHVEDNNVSFGLVRVVEMVDGKSRTIKFVFLKWQPTTIRSMLRGQINVKDAAIKSLFGSFTANYDVEAKSDISEQIIMDRIGAISGTRSNVVGSKPVHTG